MSKCNWEKKCRIKIAVVFTFNYFQFSFIDLFFDSAWRRQLRPLCDHFGGRVPKGRGGRERRKHGGIQENNAFPTNILFHQINTFFCSLRRRSATASSTRQVSQSHPFFWNFNYYFSEKNVKWFALCHTFFKKNAGNGRRRWSPRPPPHRLSRLRGLRREQGGQLQGGIRNGCKVSTIVQKNQ